MVDIVVVDGEIEGLDNGGAEIVGLVERFAISLPFRKQSVRLKAGGASSERFRRRHLPWQTLVGYCSWMLSYTES